MQRKSSDSFVRVAALDDLHPSRGTLVSLPGHEIALFLHDGKVFAIGNVCAHQHVSMLHKGEIEECVVTCPVHGWAYDFRNGQAVKGNGMVHSYAVELRGKEIYVEIVDRTPAW